MIICNRINVNKSQSIPFVQFSHLETVENSHFSVQIRFSQNVSIDDVFKTIQILELVVRHIRIFDVISEL